MPLGLVAAVEDDDTPLSYAHAFLAAAHIPNADLSVLFDQIEDIVAQADETPSTLYVSGWVWLPVCISVSMPTSCHSYSCLSM